MLFLINFLNFSSQWAKDTNILHMNIIKIKRNYNPQGSIDLEVFCRSGYHLNYFDKYYLANYINNVYPDIDKNYDHIILGFTRYN